MSTPGVGKIQLVFLFQNQYFFYVFAKIPNEYSNTKIKIYHNYERGQDIADPN